MADNVIKVDRYAVVGNPITHSLSPQIHRLFAEQTQQAMNYKAIELALDDFPAQIHALQQQGLRGANVTVPFKQQAWDICQHLSLRAEQAAAVNTLLFQENGEISGDNTDGVGLIRDLRDNHYIDIRNANILILGAGGAVRGVLAPLLALDPKKITIVNRTLEKAKTLASAFIPLGQIVSCGYEDLGSESFDLIINATAAGLKNQIPPIEKEVLGSNCTCYDMMYKLNGPTAFVDWAENHGTARAFDGLGMLVEQAAESFFIWRGVAVNSARVIAELRH